MFDYVVKKVFKRMSKSNLRSNKQTKNRKSGRSVALKELNPSSKTNLKLELFFFSFRINDTRSGSQHWGPSAAFSGQCADSLCGTKRRTRHTGSTALCPVAAACIGVPRTVPLHPPPPPPLRPHRRRMRSWSWTTRRRRRWKRTMKRMERGGKAFEEEGVSWVVLVAYWKEKNNR